jgi:enoyl-CoA hydratase/carnithine racemase
MDLREVLEIDASGPVRPDLLDRVGNVVKQLSAFPKPLIAALNGITVAGGLEIALCADIVLAADTARIGDAHANYGLVPGAGGAAILPRVIPHHIALYLLLTGRTLSAAEMKTYGLVCEVHPANELADAALALANLIAAKSPLGLQRIKQVARASMDKSREDALLHEEVTLRVHQRSQDWQEGLRAFSEKRAPVFHGL